MTNTTNAVTVEQANEPKQMTWQDKLEDGLATAYVVMHFVPLVTSIGWLIYLIGGMQDSWLNVLAPFVLLGMVSAVLTHPIRILWSAIQRIARGFWVPLTSVPFFPANLVASALGGGIMATVSLGLLLFAPAAVTLYYFFEE